MYFVFVVVGIHTNVMSVFHFFQIPDAGKDPVLVALKGRAYLNKGQNDQALKVETYNLHLLCKL